MQINNRFKNYILWAAMGAFVLDLLIYGGLVNISEKETIETLFQKFLEILVLAGIVNNPSIGKGFKDQ